MSLNRPEPFIYKWGEKSLADEVNLPEKEKTVVIPPISGANYKIGRADFVSGFPKTTMIAPSQGGEPPWGKDHNGILYSITEKLQWFQSGGTAVFDQNFCDKNGGYSWGVILQDASISTILWFSLTGENTFNPANSTQTINGANVNRSNYWKALSIEDIENLQGRMTDAENAINTKANLSGSSGQDFNAKNLNASGVNTGGLGIGGTNGIGTSSSLFSFSPQLLNTDDGGLYRKGLLNLIYAGADDADTQPVNTRQVMQIAVDRTKYTTGDNITSTANKTVLHTRRVSLYSDLYVYGTTQGAPADLSENYKSDQEGYIPGQVMMRSVKPGIEVELCTDPKRAFGIISTEPYAVMNGKREDIEDFDKYVRIAMIGRIPVWVEGPLTKEDHITATENGMAKASRDPSDGWLGWPIEPDEQTELRLVECFVTAVV